MEAAGIEPVTSTRNLLLDGRGTTSISLDQVLADASGRIMKMQRIKTGHKTSKEGNIMVDAAFLFPAANHTSERSVALVHFGEI